MAFMCGVVAAMRYPQTNERLFTYYHRRVVADPLLRLHSITKSFGSVEVLHGVDLDVARGEVVCIIGPSGSGKSTLLRCVNFIAPPTSGSVVFEGQEYHPPAQHRWVPW